ncbi:hypothetical protein HNP84_003773 [Thermocatellispora tengchongensis]|uniref:Uncharacterized protein n=1 Tax=Thermocatellispora tengchongensis TaxID=1073253 RepID=A0A840PA17_9ACTN|nr:hypothetical protein [Thermocatellispora tengchongensis]
MPRTAPAGGACVPGEQRAGRHVARRRDRGDAPGRASGSTPIRRHAPRATPTALHHAPRHASDALRAAILRRPTTALPRPSGPHPAEPPSPSGRRAHSPHPRTATSLGGVACGGEGYVRRPMDLRAIPWMGATRPGGGEVVSRRRGLARLPVRTASGEVAASWLGAVSRRGGGWGVDPDTRPRGPAYRDAPRMPPVHCDTRTRTRASSAGACHGMCLAPPLARDPGTPTGCPSRAAHHPALRRASRVLGGKWGGVAAWALPARRSPQRAMATLGRRQPESNRLRHPAPPHFTEDPPSPDTPRPRPQPSVGG